MSEWRPITITEKSIGRSVNITILEREMYLSGMFTFEDIWQVYAEPNNSESGTDTEVDEDVHSCPVD